MLHVEAAVSVRSPNRYFPFTAFKVDPVVPVPIMNQGIPNRQIGGSYAKRGQLH